MPESVPHSLSEYALKGQARELIARTRASGGSISHTQALEKISRQHGFADWNAAKAAASKHAPSKPSPLASDYPELEIPPDLEWVQTHDRIGRAISKVVRLARELETIADSARQGTHTDLLPLLRTRAYLFEHNPGRWADERFYLVDRNYDEIDGFGFDEEELRTLGFAQWGDSRYCAGVGPGVFPVMDDVFIRAADRPGLKQLARLLVPLAERVHARHRDAPSSGLDLDGILGGDDD